MKGFDEIQQLWHGQAPDPNVSFETVLKHIKNSRSAFAKKLFWQSISMGIARSEEHTSELQSLMRISYAVFCLKKKKIKLVILQHKANTTQSISNKHSYRR